MDTVWFIYLTPPVFQYLTPMAKSFSYNDSINKNSIWIDSTAYLAYNNNDANYIDCYNNSFTTNTEYVGLKILIPNDTLYGWIKVKAAKYDSMVVQEFACNLFSTNIATYQNKSSLEIYPNPSCGKFTVDNNDLKINNNDFEIYNVLGEKIYSARINTKKKEIDLLNKPKGLYFVKTVIENESVTKKIIIE